MDEITTTLQEWTAAERTADVQALSDLLTDDFIGIGPLGFSLPKAAWLARHQQGDLRYKAFDLDDVKTRRHGNAALVVARHTADGTFQGHPIPEAVRASIALIEEADRWRLAGVHFSFIAGTPGAPPIPMRSGA
jgi:ketosteroid isomerase-like protein